MDFVTQRVGVVPVVDRSLARQVASIEAVLHCCASLHRLLSVTEVEVGIFEELDAIWAQSCLTSRASLECSLVLSLALESTVTRLEVGASDKTGCKGVHTYVDLLGCAESILELRF